MSPGGREEGRARSDRAAAHRRLETRLGERYAPQAASLEAFRVYHPNQREALSRLAKVHAALPGYATEGRGLVLFGTVGAGKDHLLAASLYAACRAGLSCDWTSGAELFGRLKAAMDGRGDERAVFAELSEPQVLGLSDPTPPAVGLSAASVAWRAEQLYRLLDVRNRRLRATWAAVNVLSVEEADARLSAPVFDRLRDGAELIGCFWPSFRERRPRG